MRCVLLCIFILFHALLSSGQQLHYRDIARDTTWKTFTGTQFDSFFYGLGSVKVSNMKQRVRISLLNQIIDLYSIDGMRYEGELINTTTEYRREKMNGYELNVAGRQIFQKVELDTLKVRVVMQAIMASKQVGFPTDSLIPEWQNRFLHCSSLVFQYKYNDHYIFQRYHCVGGQNDSLPYKRVIWDNYKLIKTAFSLDSLLDQFVSVLPGGKSYSLGFDMVTVMNKKDVAAWERGKPRRQYLKSIADTVYDYVTAKLDKQKARLLGFDCFEYRLVFGLNGKLKQVSVPDYNKPTLAKSLGHSDYRERKREVKNCERRIRKVFRKVDLGFLNLKWQLYRTFTLHDDGEYDFIDNAVYEE